MGRSSGHANLPSAFLHSATTPSVREPPFSDLALTVSEWSRLMRGEGPSADMALTQLGTACHLLARLLWPQALSLVHLSRLRFSQNCCSCFSVPTSILPGALRSPIAPLLTQPCGVTPGLAPAPAPLTQFSFSEGKWSPRTWRGRSVWPRLR